MSQFKNRSKSLWMAGAFFASSAALALAAVGTVVEFNGGSDQGFSSSQTVVTNVASGGVGGAGDGYLSIDSAGFTVNLGAATSDADLTGCLSDVGTIQFSLNDIGADEALEIHVGFGVNGGGNFWQANAGFAPPNGSWQQFEVDLTDESQWTQTIGSGSFADAKANANRFLIRHDNAPYMQIPDALDGDFGVDGITLVGIERVPAATGWSLAGLALLCLIAGAAILRQRPVSAEA